VLIYVVRVIPLSRLGHTFVEATFYGGDLSAGRKVRLPVDTGSTYTWISHKSLAEFQSRLVANASSGLSTTGYSRGR
jgi:hypothetical protein